MKNNIIYGLGLHEGGGNIILLNFLKSMKFTNSKFTIYLDSRIDNRSMSYLNKKKFKLIYKKNNFINRVLLEYKLSKLENRIIFFLNGIPPIFHMKSQIKVLFQNLNIFNTRDSLLFYFSKDFLRSVLFKLGKKNVDTWFVLNNFTRTILIQHTTNYQSIKLLSLNFLEIKKKKTKFIKKFDFIYPASGLSHKNHKYLLKSLIILSNLKIYPKLVFTLSNKDYHKMNINKINQEHNTKIYNFNNLNRSKFLELFKSCDVLLYPSLSETLGLPLYEAKKLGLKIFCSSLVFNQGFTSTDYIFELSDPYSLSKIIYSHIDIKNKKFLEKELNISEIF